MTTALATVNGHQPPTPIPTEIEPATLEMVVANGDLSKLSPAQKVAWYKARCEAAGLDPRTQPFQYMNLSGKLTLYATKTATDQLISIRKLTVRIVSRTFDHDTGIYETHCRVSFADGQSVEDFGAVHIGRLQGEALANGMMKCITKAKRRTVLSACGLGMLDDSEVDTIPGARRVAAEAVHAPDAHHARHYDNGTGHGSGAYAPPASVAEYTDWARAFCAEHNQRWDAALDRAGALETDLPAHLHELVNGWQLTNHLFKFGRANGWLNAPEDARQGQKPKFLAAAWGRLREAIEAEAVEYVTGLRAAKGEELAARTEAARPEDESQEPPDDPADPDVDLPEGY